MPFFLNTYFFPRILNGLQFCPNFAIWRSYLIYTSMQKRTASCIFSIKIKFLSTSNRTNFTRGNNEARIEVNFSRKETFFSMRTSREISPVAHESKGALKITHAD